MQLVMKLFLKNSKDWGALKDALLGFVIVSF